MAITSDSVCEILKELENGDGAALFERIAEDVDWTVMGTYSPPVTTIEGFHGGHPRQVVPDDAGRRNCLPRQRHVQDLVRPQLPHSRCQHTPARQCPCNDGGRATFGHYGRDALSNATRARCLWRRWLHDELAGVGDRRACWCESRGVGPGGQRLRDDP